MWINNWVIHQSVGGKHDKLLQKMPNFKEKNKITEKRLAIFDELI